MEEEEEAVGRRRMRMRKKTRSRRRNKQHRAYTGWGGGVISGKCSLQSVTGREGGGGPKKRRRKKGKLSDGRQLIFHTEQ